MEKEMGSKRGHGRFSSIYFIFFKLGFYFICHLCFCIPENNIFFKVLLWLGSHLMFSSISCSRPHHTLAAQTHDQFTYRKPSFKMPARKSHFKNTQEKNFHFVSFGKEINLSRRDAVLYVFLIFQCRIRIKSMLTNQLVIHFSGIFK